jgi:hypothetical protein
MLVSGAFTDRTCTDTRLITGKRRVCPVVNTFAYLFNVQSFHATSRIRGASVAAKWASHTTKKLIVEHICPRPRIVQPKPLFSKSQRVFEIDRLVRLELYRALRPREESRAYFRRSGAGCPREKQYIALYVEKKGVLEDLRDTLSLRASARGCIRFTNSYKSTFKCLSNCCAGPRSPVGSKLRATWGIGSEKGYRAQARSRLDAGEPKLPRASLSGGNGMGDSLFITRTGRKSYPTKSKRDSGFLGTNRGAEPSAVSSLRSDTGI